MEITAWSFNRHSGNEFLGEVILDISGKEFDGNVKRHNKPRTILDLSLLDEKGHWYQLTNGPKDGKNDKNRNHLLNGPIHNDLSKQINDNFKAFKN